eukprot:1156013-Pelagomonas_calceolata.AAC.2
MSPTKVRGCCQGYAGCRSHYPPTCKCKCGTDRARASDLMRSGGSTRGSFNREKQHLILLPSSSWPAGKRPPSADPKRLRQRRSGKQELLKLRNSGSICHSGKASEKQLNLGW